MYLKNSRNLGHWMKINVVTCEMFKINNGGEYVGKAFESYLSQMVSLGRDIYLTHLNIMVLLKGRIGPWLKWHGVFFKPKVC
jgi:hypothetical protein